MHNNNFIYITMSYNYKKTKKYNLIKKTKKNYIISKKIKGNAD